VTKTVDAQRVNEAISCGIDLLGENRVQEFLQKRPAYSDNCEVHFIGGLQTNKVRQIINKVSMIQSVDSLKLAHEICRQTALCGEVIDVLIEVNIGGEESKHGVLPESVRESAAQIAEEFGMLRVRGLMTIPPFGESEKHFAKMQRLFEDLRAGNPEINTLSMGMSGDYEAAIAHGATIVRLGTALFGNR
jgi:hypothetical protein